MMSYGVTVRVTEENGPVDGKFRDVFFDEAASVAARSFIRAAKEDGTYWAISYGDKPFVV